MPNPQISFPPEIQLSDKRPRTAIAFDRTSGVKQLPDTAREILLIGQMGSGSTIAANTPTVLTRETDSEQFGLGCPIDVAAKAAFKANPNILLSAVGITDAGTKATGTITIAGGNAANSGVVNFYVAGRLVQLTVTAGDTPTVQATNLSALINALGAMVTSSPAAGVVTLTATCGGLIFNTVTLKVVVPVGYTPGSTYTLSGTALTGGLGTVSTTSATGAAATHRYHLVVPLFDDQTTEQAIRDYVTAQGQAEVGKGEICVTAQVGTLSAQTTQALAVNGLRNVHLSINGTDSWFVEVAAAGAAVMSAEENPTRPYNDLTLPGIKAPPQASRWTNTDQRTLIDNGCTPLRVLPGELVAFQRVVSTNVTNASGYKDYSVLDITKVQAFDYIRDAITLMFSTNYSRARWADSDPDGLLPTDVATPTKVQGDLLNVLREMEELGVCQQVEALKDQIVVNKVGTECQFSVPANIVDGMHEKLGKVVLISTPFGS